MKTPLSLLALSLATALPAHAHGKDEAGHEHHRNHGHPQAQAATAGESLRVDLPDLALTDQSGASRKLASEVIGDHIVVMDFVYTSCTTVCPVVSAIMAEVQARLGERAGGDVRLVSMTVDPLRDTPARLRDFAARHGAGKQWTWLTGRPAEINAVLKALGTYTPNFEDHPSVVMVGDGRSGRWSRYYGFPDPARLLAQVGELTAARAQAGELVAHHE